MAVRYRQGRVAPAGEASHSLAATADRAAQDYREAMDRYALHEGAAAAFRIVDSTNEFIAGREPWRLAKDPATADQLTQVLFDAAEAIRLAAVLLAPIMPASSAEILRRVGSSSDGLRLDRDGRWRNEGERLLVQEGSLWPRKETTTMTDTPVPPDAPSPGARPPESPVAPSGAPATSTPAGSPQPPASTRISIDDFMNVELRVAKVIAAERVPKSKRLLKLNVDVGNNEERTIVAGIAESYEPDTLVGRTIVVVFNLNPAKLMGIESNGMVLAASPDGGKATLVSFDEAPAPGTRVR
jgi:methionyl-tRNA synthetase